MGVPSKQRKAIFIEPSACAAFQGIIQLPEMLGIRNIGNNPNACHIIWATGGNMMPEDEKAACLAEASPIGGLSVEK